MVVSYRNVRVFNFVMWLILCPVLGAVFWFFPDVGFYRQLAAVLLIAYTMRSQSVHMGNRVFLEYRIFERQKDDLLICYIFPIGLLIVCLISTYWILWMSPEYIYKTSIFGFLIIFIMNFFNSRDSRLIMWGRQCDVAGPFARWLDNIIARRVIR